MQNSKRANIRKALASLAATHEIVVRQMEHMIDLLNHVLEAEESLEFESGDTNSKSKTNKPFANRKTLSIEWAGKSCFLGNTLLFWFFDRIARTPNQYVSHLDLLEDVWGGERKEATIRGVAKRLRDRLNECGMEFLALSIDGSESGYYGLILV